MKRFRINYLEQRPGWDEFMYSRQGSEYIEAESAEEALAKFRADSTLKYCDPDEPKEVSADEYLLS